MIDKSFRVVIMILKISLKNGEKMEDSGECTCGNPHYGFNCVCDFVKKNQGNKTFSCEFHGLYTAASPCCNKCKECENEAQK